MENRIESERCSSTSIQLVQLPTHSNTPGVSIERNTGDSEDQYRPMTPGEEEIMRIYKDEIYQATNMIKRSGGLWITGRMSPLLNPSILTTVETVDSDPELDELLRDSSDLWESSTSPYPSILQDVRQETDQWRITAQATRIVNDTLQGILEDMLPWLRDELSNGVALFDQLQDGDPIGKESLSEGPTKISQT